MKLRITLSGQEPFEVDVPGDQATVGRGNDCDVVIPNGFVSKAHVRLVRGLVACDLGSVNGTFLEDGQRLEGAGRVTNGEITIGPENIRIEVLDQEPERSKEDEMELRELKATKAGLEQKLEDLRNEIEYLRLQVDTMRKADATRVAVEELTKAQLKERGIDVEEFDRLTKTYTETLKKLESDIDSRLKQRRSMPR